MFSARYLRCATKSHLALKRTSFENSPQIKLYGDAHGICKPTPFATYAAYAANRHLPICWCRQASYDTSVKQSDGTAWRTNRLQPCLIAKWNINKPLSQVEQPHESYKQIGNMSSTRSPAVGLYLCLAVCKSQSVHSICWYAISIPYGITQCCSKYLITKYT